MSHFLVTGGAGFIGSHLSEELVRRGHRVRVADNLSYGQARKPGAHSRARRSSKATSPTSRSPNEPSTAVEYVLHQAAIPSVPRSVKDPVSSNRANVDAHAERADRRSRRGRQAARLRGLFVGVRRHAHAAQARGDAEHSRCRRTRCRRSSGSNTCRCSRGCMGWRRSRFATSTSLVRARTRRRPIRA